MKKGKRYISIILGLILTISSLSNVISAATIKNEVNSIKTIFIEIFNIALDDALVYDLETLKVDVITEFKEYSGVNISIVVLGQYFLISFIVSEK